MQNVELPHSECKEALRIIFRAHSGMNVMRVHCPMNCLASEFAHTQGSSLHPASSSICTAAILDGILSPSGGDVVLTAVGAVEQYTGLASNGISTSVSSVKSF